VARNPYYDPGPASNREAMLERLRQLITTHLKARDAEAVIPDAELQAIHPLLAVPAVWTRIRKDLDL
jgi:hypothetical protein